MLYEVFNTVIYVVLANLFYSTFLDNRCKQRKFKIVLSLIWILTGVFLTILFDNGLVARAIIALSCNVLFSVLIYTGRIPKCITVSVLFYVLVMSSDLLLISVWKLFDPELQIEQLMHNSFSVYMGTISQLLQMIIIFSLKRLFGKHKATEVDSKMWIMYVVFPLYSLVVIVLEGYSYTGSLNQFQTNTFTFMSVSLLLINLFVYWFIKQEMHRRLRAQKDMMEVTHAKDELKLYEQMESERNILGKREHEYKNVITVVLKMAKDGYWDDAIKILEKQNTELINNSNVIETGNRLISAILNSKYAQARNKGISIRINIGDLSSVKLDERDCIVIFSNILNNAIEAAEKCEEGNRYIHIKAIVEECQLVFSVHNSFLSIPINMQSQKVDVVPHGFGIENIKEAVERNHGNCFFEQQENEFVSVVILYLK